MPAHSGEEPSSRLWASPWVFPWWKGPESSLGSLGSGQGSNSLSCPNHLPEAPPPKAVILGVGILTCEFGRDTHLHSTISEKRRRLCTRKDKERAHLCWNQLSVLGVNVCARQLDTGMCVLVRVFVAPLGSETLQLHGWDYAINCSLNCTKLQGIRR